MSVGQVIRRVKVSIMAGIQVKWDGVRVRVYTITSEVKGEVQA